MSVIENTLGVYCVSSVIEISKTPSDKVDLTQLLRIVSLQASAQIKRGKRLHRTRLENHHRGRTFTSPVLLSYWYNDDPVVCTIVRA